MCRDECTVSVLICVFLFEDHSRPCIKWWVSMSTNIHRGTDLMYVNEFSSTVNKHTRRFKKMTTKYCNYKHSEVKDIVID